MASSSDETTAGPGSGPPSPAGAPPGPSAPSRPAASAQTAAFAYWKRVSARTLAAAVLDSRFDPRFMETSVRRVIAAWAAAVEAGQDAPLAAAARPAAVQIVLHPDRARPLARLVVRDLEVTEISVSDFQPDFERPLLSLRFSFAGRRYLAAPGTGAAVAGDPDTRAEFVEFWRLTADGPPPWPWRLSFGYTQVPDDLRDYDYISRPETPEEYGRRTGRAWPATAPPARHFRIQADYAEHDEKIGGGVHAFVEQDATPSRAQAEQVAWPLVRAEVRRRLGPGDWRPSLNTIEVLWLLD